MMQTPYGIASDEEIEIGKKALAEIELEDNKESRIGMKALIELDIEDLKKDMMEVKTQIEKTRGVSLRPELQPLDLIQ